MSEGPGKEGSIGLWSATSIGIGGMVGGGIFAVLGLAAQLAAGGTPVAFALAGIVALLTSYSYARLSVSYPSQGGTVEFLNQGFGTGLLTGSVNVLLWLSYTIMLSLYAFAFGSYGASFFPEPVQALWRHILISGILVMLTGLNVLGAAFVGEAEEWIVGLKILILLFFIGMGLSSVNVQQLQPSAWSRPLSLVTGGMVIFLAYEGFELIANTASDMKNPKKTLPRAYYISVGFVVVLYVLISVVTVGNLAIPKIVAARDYALAAAARPFLGSLGFKLIAVAALLSTGSAINATLYGASRISYIIARDGELPEVLEDQIWHQPVEGLLITSGLTLLSANLLDLNSISMMGSAGFLLIFAAVNGANVRLASQTRSLRWISVAGAVACLAALAALVAQRAMTRPSSLWVLGGMVGFASGVEWIYRKATGRALRAHLEGPVT